MRQVRDRIVGWTRIVVALAALVAGCQNAQRPTAEAEPASPAAPAQEQVQRERADHEAEIVSLQRQYNDILRQREAELATRADEIEALRQDIKKLKADNAELRRKIKAVKAALLELEEVVEPQTVPAEGER